MRARERAHQRRLAGAVAADEADDLAGVEVDDDVVDGMDAAERDADVAHLDERRARRATVTGSVARLAASAIRLRRAVDGVEADGDDEHDADDDVLDRRVDAAGSPCPSAATA